RDPAIGAPNPLEIPAYAVVLQREQAELQEEAIEAEIGDPIQEGVEGLVRVVGVVEGAGLGVVVRLAVLLGGSVVLGAEPLGADPEMRRAVPVHEAAPHLADSMDVTAMTE